MYCPACIKLLHIIIRAVAQLESADQGAGAHGVSVNAGMGSPVFSVITRQFTQHALSQHSYTLPEGASNVLRKLKRFTFFKFIVAIKSRCQLSSQSLFL